MQFKSLRVHKLVSGPGYNNYAIDAEIAADDNSLWDETEADNRLGELNEWVDRQLADAKEKARLRDTVRELQELVHYYEGERDRLAAEVEMQRDIIRKNEQVIRIAAERGVPGFVDELPF